MKEYVGKKKTITRIFCILGAIRTGGSVAGKQVKSRPAEKDETAGLLK